MNPATTTFACAPMQAGLLYETLSGRRGSYVQQVAISCREALDGEAMRRAWIALVGRHDALRTGFVVGDSALPRQRLHAEVDLAIAIADWRGLDERGRDRRWQELVAADRETGFEPAHPPLMRVAICRLADEQWRLLWSYHHAILDGRSRLALLRELFELYEAERRGAPAPAGSEAGGFREFAEWAATRSGDAATEAFWRGALAGITEATPAPGSRARADSPFPGGGVGSGSLSRRLDAELSDGVRELAGAQELTVASVLQSVYAILLSQESDRDDVLFASTRAGRRSAPFPTQDMVGLLMVTSPVPLHIGPEDTVIELMRRVREFNFAVRDFEHAPLPALRRWSEIAQPDPLAQTLFSYEAASMNTQLRSGDPAWKRREVALSEQLNYPLTLEALGDPEIVLSLLYDEALVPASEAERIIDRYEALVRACVARPTARVAAICELDPARRRELSGETTALRTPAAAELVPVRIRRQIARHPGRIALEHGDSRLSYGSLGARTEELAARLAELGAGPGAVVAIAMARTPDLICALLAAQWTGAAYLPLDPRYPPKRLEFMLEDSAAKIVVTDAVSRVALPPLAGRAVLELERSNGATGPGSAGAPAHAPAPDELSHLIYTSGSTGTPKAVAVEHRSVAHLTAWAEATFKDAERDGMLASTSLSFDLSVFEILVTLALGGRVVLVEDILALSDPDFRNEVVFVNSVPSALGELLRARALPPSVRTIGLAGEALPAAVVDRLYAQGQPATAVWNLYGPTEDTTYSTAYRCAPGEPPLIGRPLPGTHAYVVDRHLRALPEGVAGELLLGGLGLARGYLGQPELTAARFVELAFADGRSERAYRTGDLARWTAGGQLEYLGRIDDQVKIRGVRVEPGELEHALREEETIAEAAVVVQRQGASLRLVAYVVGAAGGARPEPAAVRSALLERLPGALIPSAIIVVDALPLTPNGKLDRRALPEAAAASVSRAPSGEPQGATELVLAELWREVLELDGQVGAEDDFFGRGGDSLQALHLLASVEDRFARRLSVRELLAATTLREQAAAIDAARSEPASGALVPLRAAGARPPWICVLPDERGVIGLRNVLPAVLSDQPVYAIQAIDPATPSWRDSSVEQIATACLRALLRRYPQGPYRLGGYSLGGFVAFDMAAKLVRSGAEVELVMLLDTAAPGVFRWRGLIVGRDRLLRHESLRRRLTGQLGLFRGALVQALELVRGKRELRSWPRGFDNPDDQAGADRLVRHYRPPSLSAPVTVLHTHYTTIRAGGPTLSWRRHAKGPLRARAIPGDHVSLLSTPAVQTLAAVIAEELERLDETAPRAASPSS